MGFIYAQKSVTGVKLQYKGGGAREGERNRDRQTEADEQTDQENDKGETQINGTKSQNSLLDRALNVQGLRT